MRGVTAIGCILFVMADVVIGQWDPVYMQDNNAADGQGPETIHDQNYCGVTFCVKEMGIKMPKKPTNIGLVSTDTAKVKIVAFQANFSRERYRDTSCLCYRGVSNGEECDTSDDCVHGNTCITDPSRYNCSFCLNETDKCTINREGMCHRTASKPIFVNNTCLCRCEDITCDISYYNQYCALYKNGSMFQWGNECLFQRQHCNLTVDGIEALFKINRHCSTINTGDTNYAIGGTTMQSTTKGSYYSSKVIDNSNETALSTQHCAQTERETAGSPYLRVLLKDGIPREIFRISILLPTDCDDCIAELHHARIRLWNSKHGLYPSKDNIDEFGNEEDTSTILGMISTLTEGSNARVFNFHPNDRGNLVEIEAETANKRLTICEIQVFSHPDYSALV